MKYCVLFAGLVCLSQIPAIAQETISTNSQSIQGTWISQVTDPAGNLALFEVGMYPSNGPETVLVVEDASYFTQVGAERRELDGLGRPRNRSGLWCQGVAFSYRDSDNLRLEKEDQACLIIRLHCWDREKPGNRQRQGRSTKRFGKRG